MPAPCRTVHRLPAGRRYDVDCTSGHSDGGYFGCPAPGADRFHFEANIPAADWASYYTAVFEAPVKAKPAGIMCR